MHSLHQQGIAELWPAGHSVFRRTRPPIQKNTRLGWSQKRLLGLSFLIPVISESGSPGVVTLASSEQKRDRGSSLAGGHSCLFPGLKPYLDAVFRTQGDRSQRRNLMFWNELKTELLSNRCQHHARFHQRKCVPDALARAAAKRKVRESRKLLGQTVLPALGAKLQRSIEPTCIAVYHQLRKRHAVAT